MRSACLVCLKKGSDPSSLVTSRCRDMTSTAAAVTAPAWCVCSVESFLRWDRVHVVRQSRLAQQSSSVFPGNLRKAAHRGSPDCRAHGLFLGVSHARAQRGPCFRGSSTNIREQRFPFMAVRRRRRFPRVRSDVGFDQLEWVAIQSDWGRGFGWSSGLAVPPTRVGSGQQRPSTSARAPARGRYPPLLPLWRLGHSQR